MAQTLLIPNQSVDISKLMHNAENEILFRTLLTIHYIIRDSSSNREHRIYLACSQAEADILNDWCQGNKESALRKYFRVSATPWFKTYLTILSNQYGNLTKSQRKALQNLHFQPVDYLLGINSTNEFKENILLALNDCFANSNSKEIPITLRSIRSYAHYLEVTTSNSEDGDYEEGTDSRKAGATFSATGTFASVIDSIAVLDSFAARLKNHARWMVYRNMLTTYQKGYKEYESSAGHLRRIIAAAQSVPVNTDSVVSWLIESKNQSADQSTLFQVIKDLRLPVLLKSVQFLDKSSVPLLTDTSDSMKISMDFLKEVVPFWGLADYNLNPVDHDLEDSEIADSDYNATSMSLPYGVVGITANQNIVDLNSFNRALNEQQLSSVLSQSLGAEVGIRGPEMGYVILQYSAQNQWLNWNSQPHYRNYNWLFSSLVPLWEHTYVQSYLGFDYQYSNHQYSTTVENVFIGNPTTNPIVWNNNAHLLGLSLRMQIRLASFYIAAQGAYRWDVSDARWYRGDQPINSEDKVNFSGMYFSLSTGWFWGDSR